MVKEEYDIDGHDIDIDANILVEAELGDSFTDANSRYYDNDSRQFAPHADATDAQKNDRIVRRIERLLG